MGDDNTQTVDPDLRSAVSEALKSIPGFTALMAEAAKRSAETNEANEQKDKEKDKENARHGELITKHSCRAQQ